MRPEVEVEYHTLKELHEGERFKLSEIDDFRAALLYIYTVENIAIFEKTFHLPPVMNEDVIYRVNPERGNPFK